MSSAQARFDVAIVGAGLIGMATAHALRREGLEVALIDRDQPGAATSWGNCGLIEPSHADPLTQPAALMTALKKGWRRDAPLRIAPTLSPQRLSWFLRFARHCTQQHREQIRQARYELLVDSRDALEALIAERGLQMDYRRAGLLTFYLSMRGFDEHLAVHEALGELGLDYRTAEGAAIAELEPQVGAAVKAAIVTESDGHLDPVRYGKELARVLSEDGVNLRVGAPVTGIDVEDGRATGVRTRSERIKARAVVVCAGAWSPQLVRPLGLRLPIQPGKGFSITWQRPADGHRRPIYFYERKVVLTPWSNGYRLGSTMEFRGFDRSVPAHRLQPLMSAPAEYLQQRLPGRLDDGFAWAGFRPMCVDEMPIIGRSQRIGNLWLACGHGQLGVSLAMGTGRLVAALFTGREPAVDPAPYSPNRFGL